MSAVRHESVPSSDVVNDHVLEAVDLRVGYRDGRRERTTLSGVELGIRRGELAALVGANGAGKSTLLRSITAVQPVLEGTVRLGGDDLTRLDRRARARRIALVLAERIDAPGLTVREVLALGRHPHTSWTGTLDDEDRAVLADAARATGVEPYLDRRVAELSDGERQRVAIARAVAQQPDVLVLDEPTAFLDPRGRMRVVSLVRRLCDEGRFAAIVATHDLDLVLPRASRVWVAGGGVLVTGSLGDRPVSEALRRELGARVLLVDGRAHISYDVEDINGEMVSDAR